MKRQRNSYTVEEKRKAVELARRVSIKYAARYFTLDPTMLGRWVKRFSQEEDNLLQKNTRSIGSGRRAFFPEEETQLYRWIMDSRKSAVAIKYASIRWKMAEIMKESAEKTQDETKKLAISNFKCSTQWLSRFLKRHDLSLRRKTKIAQKLPKDLEEKLLSFQRFIIRLRQKNDYPLGMIANMDETPVCFDMAGDLTVNPTGTKTVHIRTTGNEKNRFTVVLTCFADGTKLPPIIIFKGKAWPRNAPPRPNGVVVWFQEKGWMDEAGMKKWTKYWGRTRPGGLRKSKAMLVFDSFSGHLTDQVKAALRSENTDLVVIPGGLTSMCQPLDVSINKPFKDNLRRCWHDWMVEGGNGVTKGGNLKRADLATACKWVLSAWNDISEEIIIRAFKKCGISNCLTGIEDHLIYEHDEDENGEEETFDKDGESDEDEYGDANGENSDEDEEDIEESENFQECVVMIESS